MEALSFWAIVTAIVSIGGFSYMVYLGMGDKLPEDKGEQKGVESSNE